MLYSWEAATQHRYKTLPQERREPPEIGIAPITPSNRILHLCASEIRYRSPQGETFPNDAIHLLYNFGQLLMIHKTGKWCDATATIQWNVFKFDIFKLPSCSKDVTLATYLGEIVTVLITFPTYISQSPSASCSDEFRTLLIWTRSRIDGEQRGIITGILHIALKAT